MELWVGQLLAGIILFVLTFLFTVVIPPLIIRQQKKADGQRCDRDCEGLVIDNPGYQGAEDHKSGDEERLLGESEDLVCNPDVGVDESTSLLKRLLQYDLISAINCFCGGLFVGICVLDMIPTAQQDTQNALEANDVTNEKLPLAEIVICGGLFMVMVVEMAMTSCFKVDHHRNDVVTSQDERVVTSQQQEEENVEKTRAYVLIVALIFHSFFEGMAIGLTKDLSYVFQLLLGLALHKCPFGFGVGTKVFRCVSFVRALILTTTFSLASPIGALVGAIIAEQKSAGMLAVEAVFSCLVAGTFLYITFVEVLPEEFGHQHRSDGGGKKKVGKFPKLSLLFVGFAITVSLHFL